MNLFQKILQLAGGLFNLCTGEAVGSKDAGMPPQKIADIPLQAGALSKPGPEAAGVKEAQGQPTKPGAPVQI